MKQLLDDSERRKLYLATSARAAGRIHVDRTQNPFRSWDFFGNKPLDALLLHCSHLLSRGYLEVLSPPRTTSSNKSGVTPRKIWHR